MAGRGRRLETTRCSDGGISRRDLLRGSLAIAAVPGSCCTTEPAPPESYRIEGEVLTLDLALAPSLNPVDGSAKIVDVSHGLNLIIVNLGERGFVAADRSCTHGGAQVVWSRYHRALQCTSWGHSEFDREGNVLGGSAKEPLRVYPVTSAGGTILEVQLA